MAALTCAHCGQVIIGNGRPSRGKTYCVACYDKIVKEQEAMAVEKQDLCTYMKKVFGVSEITTEVMYTIDRLVREGKKLRGMKATLYYYFEVLGNDGVSIMLLYKIINEQYDNARIYLDKMRKLKEHNDRIDITAETITYVISDKEKHKRKPQRKIEDL